MPLFEQVAESMGWIRWVDTIKDMYQRMYFVMNNNIWTNSPTKAGLITMEHVNGDYEVNYAPYYGHKINSNAYNWYGLPENGYGYWFYKQKDLNINWEFALWDYDTQQNWYYQIQQAYEREVKQAYTQVPIELIPLGGVMQNYNGQEKDFVDKLTEEITEISLGQAQHMIHIVTQAAYGQKKTKQIDQEFVRKEYQSVMKVIYSRLKWYQKIIWNYFK